MVSTDINNKFNIAGCAIMSSNLPASNSTGPGYLKPIVKTQPVDRAARNTNETVDEQINTSQELKRAQAEGINIPVSEEQVIKAIDRAIKALEGTSTRLDFSIHEKTKHIMVKVLDKDTGEVIREIPPERSLDFLAKVWEMAGILIDEKR